MAGEMKQGNGSLFSMKRTAKVSILVWARGPWRSMPHVTFDSFSGQISTACGRDVSLGDGVTGIVLTQIKADLFMATGCGLCTQSLLAELRAQAREARPEAKEELRRLLRQLDWKTEE